MANIDDPAATAAQRILLTESLSDPTWEKMYPWLQEFLPDEVRYYPRSKLEKLVRQYQEKYKKS